MRPHSTWLCDSQHCTQKPADQAMCAACCCGCRRELNMHSLAEVVQQLVPTHPGWDAAILRRMLGLS